jgi:hypothetical protein
MAHYQVKIQISSVRVPDPPAPPPQEPYDPGKDPVHEVAQVMRESMAALRAPAIPMHGYGFFLENGLTLTKEIEIHAESFEELAKALGQFDTLAEQIECANPTKKW